MTRFLRAAAARSRGRHPARWLVLLALACGRGDLESPDPAARATAVRALSGAKAPLAPLLVAERDASPLVRRAAAEAFSDRGGGEAAEALATLVVDRDPDVAVAAAAGLARMPADPRARAALVSGYAGATPRGRAAVAEALERVGVSLREAIEAEARQRWDRNVATLERGSGAPRAGAAEEVGASARNEAVQRLVPLVDPNRNPDRLLAAAAARGLGESGDWAARPFLEALLADGDPFLAETAAAALGRLGDPSAADALAAAATGAPGRVANAAGEALAALPEAPEVGVALCELAVRSPDPALAARAAREARHRDADCPSRPLLGRLGQPGSLAALAALGALRFPPEAAAATVEKVAPLLDPARNPDAELRAAAARALAGLGGPVATAAVQRRAQAAAEKVAEGRTRWVARVLPASAPPKWTPSVPAGQARELGALLSALGRLRAEGAPPILTAFLNDPLPAIRAGAVDGLARSGAPGTADVVAAALADPDDAVRLAAAEGLARLGAAGAAALAAAAERAGSADGAWRVVLARALGETGAATTIPALTRLLDAPSGAAAALALARLGAPAGVAPLVEYLGRAEAPARAEAIEALAQLAARDAAPAIAALLTDERPEVRASAARALGRLRHEAASSRLEALRSDYYGRVRRAAVEALSKLPAGAPRSRR